MILGVPNNNAILQDAPTYQLLINGGVIEESIPVLGIVIKRAFNKIATAQLVVKDGRIGGGESRKTDFPIQNKEIFKPGNRIEIKIGHRGENSYNVFTGMITGLKVRVRKASSKLIVECKSEAYKLSLQPKSRYFFESTDADIITTILQEYGINNEVEDTSLEHPELVQYEASDWHFLLARAEENGLFVRINELDEVEVVKLDFDQKAIGIFEYGRNVYELDAEIDTRLQFEGVKLQSWDYNEQAVIEQEAVPAMTTNLGNLGADELAEVNQDELKVIRNGGFKLDSELQTKADAILLRDRLAKIRGRVKVKSVKKVVPGDLIDLRSIGDRFTGIALVSGVRYELSSANSWMLDIQFGFSNEWKIEQLFEHRRQAISKFVPGINGLHIGLVTQIHDDPEEANRIKVRLPMIELNEEGVWARIAKFDAGRNRGSFFMPEVDDEVIVGFIDNDPKEAVVLGMLHSSANPAPLDATEDNDKKGFFSREGLKILFDDDNKAITIETPGTGSVLFKSPKVDLAGENGESVVLGDTLNTHLTELITTVENLTSALSTFSSAQNGVTGAPGPLSPLGAAYAVLTPLLPPVLSQLTATKLKLQQHLSTKVKSE